MLSLQKGKEVWGENEQCIKEDNRANQGRGVSQEIVSQDFGRRNVRGIWEGRKYMKPGRGFMKRRSTRE
jgi:hypothetical protein